ncbi:MAG: hypothetical protein WB608_05485 [Terracidiphilus sp.]
MGNVISFTPSPLTPFLGKWVRDPISVSRNKVASRTLGEDGLKKLWACESMQECLLCLREDPALTEKYQALLQFGAFSGQNQIEITHRTIAWNDSSTRPNSAGTSVSQVIKVSAEGRKVVVESISLRTGVPARHIGYVLRMNKQWLLVSERYYGAQAGLFPRSPVFRYYRPV